MFTLYTLDIGNYKDLFSLEKCNLVLRVKCNYHGHKTAFIFKQYL